MARIRSVHPGFFTDEGVVSVSMVARVCVIGLGVEADDKGIFEWKPLMLKMRLFPADNIDMNEVLAELQAADLIRQYEFGGKHYGAVRNFRKFQKPKTPNDIHPAPDDIRNYVGLGATASETVDGNDAPFPPKGEKPPQMEDGGGKRSSEPIGSVAAPSAVDVTKVIFDTGVDILMGIGHTNAKARDVVGKWRKAYSDSLVLACISRCQIERPSDPIGWMTKALQFERSRQNGQSAAPPAQPTTLDAIRGAIDATGGSEGRDAASPGTGDWGAWDMPDPMLALGHVER